MKEKCFVHMNNLQCVWTIIFSTTLPVGWRKRRSHEPPGVWGSLCLVGVGGPPDRWWGLGGGAAPFSVSGRNGACPGEAKKADPGAADTLRGIYRTYPFPI